MSGGMTMFQSELRTAVREARAAPVPAPSPKPGPVRIVSQPRPTRRLRQVGRDVGDAHKRTAIRLWLPLTPLWIVLAPFALLLAPLMLLAPPARGAPPIRTALSVGAVLLALSGTVVEVDTPDALIRIRIF